jgi:two-component system, NarL family, sensor histidine kinase EvgS
MLSAKIGHEMIMPLNCIISFASDSLSKLDSLELPKNLKLITSTAKMMRCQFKDLLDRNLIEEGSLRITYNLRNVAETLKEIASIV